MAPTMTSFEGKITKLGDEIAGLTLKQAVDLADYMKEAYKIEMECASDVMKSEDAKEGPRAFMEKRPPRFTGR